MAKRAGWLESGAPPACRGGVLDEVVDGADGRAPHEHDAVRRGVLGAGDGDVEGVNVPRGGAPQRACRLTARARFELADALGRYDLEIGDPVGATVGLEHLEMGAVLLRESQNHGARPAEEEAELLRPHAVEGASTRIDLGLDGAGGGVVARVHEAPVRLGGAEGDVVGRFQYADREIVPCELPGYGTPGHTRAGDDDVERLGHCVSCHQVDGTCRPRLRALRGFSCFSRVRGVIDEVSISYATLVAYLHNAVSAERVNPPASGRERFRNCEADRTEGSGDQSEVLPQFSGCFRVVPEVANSSTSKFVECLASSTLRAAKNCGRT